MFRYLDRSLEVRDDVELSEDIFFRRNLNKYNGVCENSEEERERCSKYYMERLSLLEGSPQKNEIPENSENNTNETGTLGLTRGITIVSWSHFRNPIAANASILVMATARCSSGPH